MLAVNNLTCVRGDRPLFSGLSFTIKYGELLHVMGSNGAGKTTLLRSLCGLTRPAEGDIHWNGQNIRALDDDYRSQLVYIGHSNGVQGELTAKENLAVAALLAGTVDTFSIDQALEKIGLAGLNHLPAKVLSQGQKRRLGLARLLVLQKPLWILDEPFSALDARSTAMMTDLLAEHLASGGMIVITSHQELTIQVTSVLRISLDS